MASKFGEPEKDIDLVATTGPAFLPVRSAGAAQTYQGSLFEVVLS